METSTVIPFQAPEPTVAASPSVPVSDEHVLRALDAGDPRFGQLLHDRIRRIVHATVHRVLGHADSEHDDVVQMSFEQIVRSLARGHYKRNCSLTSWAATVTTNVVLNVIRGRRTRRRFFLDPGKSKGSVELEPDEWNERLTPLTERAMIARRELNEVRVQLAAMNPERAEALVLHDVMEYELSEMAILLGTSVAALQSRLVRGRKELKARISEKRGAGA
jgi:RNA polymerase sigma factor (sigma-70 family)